MKPEARPAAAAMTAETTSTPAEDVLGAGENDNAQDRPSLRPVSFDDAIARTRKLPITPANTLPAVPATYQPTSSKERVRRFRRPADHLMAGCIEAAHQILARRKFYKVDFGDMAPDIRRLDVVLPELAACKDTIEHLEGLLRFHKERYDIARGDLHAFLSEAHGEHAHRVSRRAHLATDYAKLVDVFAAERAAIAAGIENARQEKARDANKDSDEEPGDEA